MTYQKHSYLLNGGDHRLMKVREGRCTAFTYIQSQGKNEGPKLALCNQIYFLGSKYSQKPLQSYIFYNLGSIVH